MDVKDKAIRDRITGAADPADLNRPLFIKAGAGAGKTTCIQERVLNLIKSGISPERLVVITYTTKAASELINRIRDALESSSHPAAEEALNKLSEAKISTVHSFCYDLLREYPMEFALDPEARLADEKTTALMLDNCYNRMLVNLSDGTADTTGQAVFRRFVGEQDSKTQGYLKETLLEMYRNRDLMPVELDSSSLPQASHLESERDQALRDYYAWAVTLRDGIKEGCEDDKFYLHLRRSLGEVLDRVELADFPAFVLAGRTNLIIAQGVMKNYAVPADLKNLKDAAKSFKSSHGILELLEKATQYQDALEIYPLFEETVVDYKKLYGYIDYFDCLYLVREGFKAHKALGEMAAVRFDALIIDEFQDSDPMQADIAFLLARDNPGKLFFVGDPKQSIYGFARADLETYGEAEERIGGLSRGGTLELTTNFRSAGGLLSFINDTFRPLLKDLAYEDMVPAPGHGGKPFFTEKWVLDPPGEKLKAEERRIREAAMTACRLEKLMAEKNLDPADILILFRSSTAMKYYQKALEDRKIPVVNHANREVLKQRDMRELLNLMSLCAFPRDKFYRYGVDHSSLFGFSPDVLDEVLERPEGFLGKFRELFDLSGLAALALKEGREEYLFLKKNLCILAETELNSNGHNLKKTMNDLKEKALKKGFQLKGNGPNETVYLQRRRENALRLMTIHSSKGLESRVVVLVGHEVSTTRQKSQIVDRANERILVKSAFLSDKMAEKFDLKDLTELYEKLEKDREEEEKRLLYVAVTRAEEGFALLTSSTANNTSFIDPLLNGGGSFSVTETLTEGGGAVPVSSSRTNTPSPSRAGNLGDILAGRNPVSRPATELIAEPELFTGIEGRRQGTEFGTFVHAVMEVMCLLIRKKGRDLPVDAIVDRVYRDSGVSLPDSYPAEVKAMARRFLAGKLAERIEKADRVETELPFHLTREIHGRVDLILEEEGKLHIIDFKSDLLKEKSDEIKAHYAKQTELYVRSVGEITGKAATGECVYLFTES